MKTILQPAVRKLHVALALLLLATLNPQLSTAFAQGAAFTYQGRLSEGGLPASGTYDLRFAIYDSNEGDALVGGPLTNVAVAVSDGLFTVTLDFGAGVFSGGERWLEIAARPGTNTGAYTTLSRRQPITSTPFALSAANLTGTLPFLQLPSGVVTNNATGISLTGTFSGNGGGLANLLLTRLSATGPNRIRSIETSGIEQLYLRARKNLDIETINDATFLTGRNFTAAVDNDTSFLGRSNVAVTVDHQLSTFVHSSFELSGDQDLTPGTTGRLGFTAGTLSLDSGGSATATFGTTLDATVGDRANLTVGNNLVAAVSGSASLAVAKDLTVSVDGNANLTFSKNLGVEAEDNLNLTATRLAVLTPGGVSISTADTGAVLQVGDAGTPNSQGMIRLASLNQGGSQGGMAGVFLDSGQRLAVLSSRP